MIEDPNMSALDLDEDGSLAMLSEEGRVRCAFSTAEEIKVGVGSAQRKRLSKLYWYVEELGAEKFTLRQINANKVPFGGEQVIGLKELMKDFTPEVEFFETEVVPAMELLEDYLDEGDHHREEGRLYSAEGAYQSALGLDESNVRALFNLGIVYLDLHNLDRARDMLSQLVKLKSAFSGKDQHLFNEFGISLRKNGLFDEAVEYYSHALEYVANDEHLYYNLARAHYERGDWKECVAALTRSRELNPDLSAALDLGQVVMEMARDEELCRELGKPPVPREVAAEVNGVMRPSSRPLVLNYSGDGVEIGRARNGMYSRENDGDE